MLKGTIAPKCAAGTIHPRVSVNAMCTYSWSQERDLAFYQATGIRKIGLSTAKLRSDPASIASIRDSALLVSTVLIQPSHGERLSFFHPEHAREGIASILAGIEVARAVRAPTCYFLTGPTPPCTPTDAAVKAFVASISQVGSDPRFSDVRLAIEHNSTATRESGFIHTLVDAIDVASAAGIDVCVELQNCWTERHVAETLRRGVPFFALVQVSDFVVGTQTRLTRAVPGDGDIPLEWMLGELLESGYQGDFDIEIVGPRIEQEGYESATLRSIQWLSDRLWQWGV